MFARAPDTPLPTADWKEKATLPIFIFIYNPS